MVGSEAAASGSGGSLHGGEGLRLKLQTPLFVADALMEAARVRLEAQTAAAKRELSSLESVKAQLARFKVMLDVCSLTTPIVPTSSSGLVFPNSAFPLLCVWQVRVDKYGHSKSQSSAAPLYDAAAGYPGQALRGH